MAQLDPRTLIPIPAIALTTIISCLLALINIGSSTAFNDIVSLSVVALFSSYLIATVLFLWRRCTGAIVLPTEVNATSLANTPGAQLVWGPWRIPGIWGIANNVFACAYLAVILFFCCWPATTPVTAATMNYSSLLLGAAVLLSVVYYAVWARKSYVGPVVEVEYR